MRLKLKEDPREWRKFALTGCAVAGALACLLWWRSRIRPDAFFWILAALGLTGGSAVLRARWFRLPYRVAMTVSFRIGQVVGRILLAIFFVVVLTPFALVLRLLGKDFLKLKRGPNSQTYWHPTKVRSEFDRQF